MAQREADHAQLYRRALTDAQDDILLANTERDWSREEMQSAFENRSVLIRALSAIEEEHHFRGGRCACGRRGCRTAESLSDPRVSRLLRSFDEEQRTLHELRVANPELWADPDDELWDFVDVTLVYPKRERRTAGRHRAAG